jgi:hypothetical protein
VIALSATDRLNLTDAVDVVTAVPSLVGHHPVRSLVVLCVAADKTVPCAIRVDLAGPELHVAQLRALVPVVRNQKARRVAVVIVDDAAGPDRPTYSGLVRLARSAFASIGVLDVSAFWASSTRPGGVVRCYDDPAQGGAVPDTPSVLAVQNIVAGQVVFSSRDEISRLFQPSDPDAIGRREQVLNAASDQPEPPGSEYLALVRSAVASPPDPADDHHLIQLAKALSDYRVRDAVMAVLLGENARRAEELWFTLVRELPAPERAEPAVMIALAAMLRGEGTLANIALDVAEQALPGHSFARILRSPMACMVPMGRFREVVQQASAEAIADIEYEENTL